MLLFKFWTAVAAILKENVITERVYMNEVTLSREKHEHLFTFLSFFRSFKERSIILQPT